MFHWNPAMVSVGPSPSRRIGERDTLRYPASWRARSSSSRCSASVSAMKIPSCFFLNCSGNGIGTDCLV